MAPLQAVRDIHPTPCGAPALMVGCVLPAQLNLKANDTGGVFNWHPLLMALAFPVFMGEAVMAYRAPLTQRLEQCGPPPLHHPQSWPSLVPARCMSIAGSSVFA